MFLVLGASSSAADVDEAYLQFALAQAFLQESDYAGARAAFEKASALESNEPYLKIAYAEFLYQLGELDAALGQAAAARELDPENAEPLRLLARIALRQTDKSAEAVDRALELFAELGRMLPDDLESRISSGRLLMSLGRFEEAAVVLTEAYELRPDDPRLASLLLSALERLEDHTEAERGLRSLLGRFPDLLEARMALANLLAARGRHGDAVDLLRGATPAERQSLEVLRVLTLELYRIGSWEEALAASETWLELAPDETSARYLNALGLAALARYNEAETALRSLYEDEQGSFDIGRALAEVIERQGRPEEAAELLSKTAVALEQAGQGGAAVRARLELLDLAVRAGYWEQVIGMTAELRATEGMSGNGEIGLIRAQALLEAGRSQEAIALLATLGADPEVGKRARARGAEALFRAGENERAERMLMELADSGDVEQVIVVAETLQRLDLYDQAISLWLRAKAETPAALDVRFWLGSAYERSGRRELAIREFRELLERDDQFAPALNYLGYMWAERGENLAEAVGLVGRAVALEPSNGAYADSLGWALYQLGNYVEARKHLENAARLVGEDAVVFEHLGDLYLALGQRSLAAQSYQRALALADDNEEAVRRKLGQLTGGF